MASGETADANDSLEALDEANSMLQQWCLEDLMLYYSKIDILPLVAGQILYQIGPTGADLVMVRPVELISITYRDSANFDRAVSPIAYEDYANILQKSTVGIQYPTMAAYQPISPNGNLYIWPTPISGSLRILSNNLFDSILDTANDVPLALGVEDCFVYGLSERLCIKYGRSEMMPQISEQYMKSKLNVKRKNTKNSTMTLSSRFLPKNTRSTTYNPNTDQ